MELLSKLSQIFIQLDWKEPPKPVKCKGSSTRLKLNSLFISNLMQKESKVYDDNWIMPKNELNSLPSITVTGRYEETSETESLVLFNDKSDIGTIKDLRDKMLGTLSTVENDNEETSREFALSKAIYSVLQKKRNRRLVESELLESQAGISIQYSHVRLAGIKRYLEETGFAHVDITLDLISRADLSPLYTNNINNELQLPPKLIQLVNHMSRFHYHRQRGLEEPSVFINYTAMLARMVSSLYYHFRVKNEEENIQIARWIVLGIAKRMLFISISATGLIPMTIV